MSGWTKKKEAVCKYFNHVIGPRLLANLISVMMRSALPPENPILTDSVAID